jgi:hypothetical protein
LHALGFHSRDTIYPRGDILPRLRSLVSRSRLKNSLRARPNRTVASEGTQVCTQPPSVGLPYLLWVGRWAQPRRPTVCSDRGSLWQHMRDQYLYPGGTPCGVGAGWTDADSAPNLGAYTKMHVWRNEWWKAGLTAFLEASLATYSEELSGADRTRALDSPLPVPECDVASAAYLSLRPALHAVRFCHSFSSPHPRAV